MTITRPGLDPELSALLSGMPMIGELDPAVVAQLRRIPPATPLPTLLEQHDAGHRAVTIGTRDGGRITLSVFTPPEPVAGAPWIYWIHGGGMVMGDRFAQIDIPLDWLDRFGATVVTVDYRLAPDVHGETLVEDCYEGLLWTAAQMTGATPLVVAGTSAGGGLAAGVTLLARDRGGPDLAAQVLICPMLDHRNDTTSARQFAEGPGTWTRPMNEYGWQAVLGGEEASAYVSPALAGDLSGLPATFIDVGSAEVFRDEDIAYAFRIWAAGGQAELHVWAGGFHGFDALFPQARLSVTARRTRTDWLERVLGAGPSRSKEEPGPRPGGACPTASSAANRAAAP